MKIWRRRTGRALIALVLGALVGVGVAGVPDRDEVPTVPEVSADPATTTTSSP